MTQHLPPQVTQNLLDRVRSGDMEAWNTLDQQHRYQLSLIVRGRIPHQLRGLYDTDDLVQSAILSAFSELDSFEFRGQGSFRSWLSVLISNKLKSRVRRHRTSNRNDFGRSEIESETPVESRELDPSSIASRSDSYARLLTCMSEIREEKRELLSRRFFGGEAFGVLAAGLGASETTARRKVAEAVMALRDRMRDADE